MLTIVNGTHGHNDEGTADILHHSTYAFRYTRTPYTKDQTHRIYRYTTDDDGYLQRGALVAKYQGRLNHDDVRDWIFTTCRAALSDDGN